MKKFLKILSAALLVVVLAFALTGCDKSGSIKKAFEDQGYSVSVVNSENSTVVSLISSTLTEEQKKDLANYEIILCSKTISVAVIIKCGSEGDLKEFLTTEDENGKKDTSSYDKAKEDGCINGNCYIITASAGAKEIFQKA